MKKMLLPTALLLSFALLLTLLTGMAVRAEGSAPVAENLELATYRGVSVGGCLKAVDPDGDRLSFEITTPPTKGSVDLGEDGHFVYTPGEGRRGKDYFGYKAIDPEGNSSQEATVIVKIQKQKSKVTYSDTSGLGSACAALRLAEEELFVGECLAGSYVFCPERPVTREEFLVMCMRLAGTKPYTATGSTGFADDEAIETWARPYVGAALRAGVISGYAGETGISFDPDRNVTAAEAAVILDRALGLTSAIPAWFSYDDALPAWVVQSAANITACGILPDGCSLSSDTLSRAEAAEMLSGAMDVLAKR